MSVGTLTFSCSLPVGYWWLLLKISVQGVEELLGMTKTGDGGGIKLCICLMNSHLAIINKFGFRIPRVWGPGFFLVLALIWSQIKCLGRPKWSHRICCRNRIGCVLSRTMTTWKEELTASAHRGDFNIWHSQSLVSDESQGNRRSQPCAKEVRDTKEGGSGFPSNGGFRRAEMTASKDDKEGVGDFRMTLPQTAGWKHERKYKRKHYTSSREK